MTDQERGAALMDAIEDAQKARDAYRLKRHTDKEKVAVEVTEERLGALLRQLMPTEEQK